MKSQRNWMAISLEEHEVNHRAGPGGAISPERLAEMMKIAKGYATFPFGISLNEISAKDMYAALKELEEYRQSELRPAEKFLTNTMDQQMQHIEQEFDEVREALKDYKQTTGKTTSKQMWEAVQHLAEELTDSKTSCETMLAIIGYNAAARRAEVRKVNDKNERRNYFDRTE